MYRKRVFGIRPADDEQKPISLFHNRYHNQRVAEVRNQETDSGVSVGFRPLPQTTPTTCSAWPGSTGELRPPDRNRAGRRQIFAPPVQNSAPDTAQLTPINAPTPASHPISSPKRQKPTVLRGVHVANSIATLRKRLSVALARTLFRLPCCQTISRRRNILRNS